MLEDGHVVTNALVVWPFDSARVVFPDGSEFHEVPVRGWDLLADLAVLGPINRPTDGLALSDGEGLPIGANLFLIGYPAETEKFPQPTIVRGLLSRVREWESVGITYRQVDATIIGGQSGGALVSEAGHVIGISGLRFTEANFAMVASASDFIPRAKELIDGRNPSELGDRGALPQGGELRHGITLENYWSQRAYLINEPPGALIDFELTGDNDGGFTIYDPYGFELLSADNGSTGAEDGAYTIERDEPHFLVAWQWPETIGDFTLKSSHRLTQIHDPDDGRQLQVSQPARGNIDFPTDLDYFLVDLTEGEVIEVIAESSVADTFLTIDYVGALDTQIIVDDDSGAGLLGLDSAIIYRAPHTGRYFVVVSDANYSAPGGYVITVKRAARNAVPTTTTWASLFGESVATEPPSAQSAFGLAELRSAFTGTRQVVGGDTLIIRLDEYERTQEVRYLGCDDKHYVVTPSSIGNELLMAKVTIWNDKARSVLLVLDSEASQLRGTAAQQKFAPMDVDAMKRASQTPTDDQVDMERHYARPGASGGYYHCGQWTTTPEVQFLQSSVQLDQGNSLSGWIAYEVPVGTELREIHWAAGDTIYLNLSDRATLEAGTVPGLPSSFQEADPAELYLSIEGLGFEDYYRDLVVFLSSQPFEMIMAMTGQVSDAQRIEVDEEIMAVGALEDVPPNLLSAAFAGEQEFQLHDSGLLDLSRIGATSYAVYTDLTTEGTRLRIDFVVFRRGNLVGIVYLYYLPSTQPLVSVEEAARMLDAKMSDIILRQ